ncbi:MAG: hypothetical protein PW788_07265 [Micavibrio sp.]|nr:hypothetical protein [Micavibrio sp.]
MNAIPFKQKLYEFGLLLLCLYAWFLVQYLAIQRMTESSVVMPKALAYSVICYWIFYVTVRKRGRVDQFFFVSLGLAAIGFGLWFYAEMSASHNPHFHDTYVSSLGLPLDGFWAGALGIASDPIMLMPFFAGYLLNRVKR